MPGSIVNVPQGRGAILYLDERSTGYDALYTDAFSECNILTCVGSNGIALFHIDRSTDLPQVQAALAKLGTFDADSLYVFYREGKGEEVFAKIKEQFHPFTYIHVPAEVISISLNKVIDATTAEYYSMSIGLLKPNNWVHHPLERKFNAVHKIEQPLGKQREVLIFEANQWQPIPAVEMLLSEAMTNDLKKKDPGEIPYPIRPYVMDYLTNFTESAEELFVACFETFELKLQLEDNKSLLVALKSQLLREAKPNTVEVFEYVCTTWHLEHSIVDQEMNRYSLDYLERSSYAPSNAAGATLLKATTFQEYLMAKDRTSLDESKEYERVLGVD